MREIKFRAFKVSGKFMFDWDDIKTHGWKFNSIDDPDLILMQNTGMTDKNGTEIYEGDELTMYRSKQWGTVRWNEYQGGWYVGSKSLNRASAKANKVIGNAYQSPEMSTPSPQPQEGSAPATDDYLENYEETMERTQEPS